MKSRHIPIRSCVACRETNEKRRLLRVVRGPDGTAAYDARGKQAGRGAYVCARQECIQAARKQRRLERALQITAIPPQLFEELSGAAAAEGGAE